MPFARPTLVSLLCLMIAVGHAPAWLHVATCDHQEHTALSEYSAAPSLAACSHGCHQHSVKIDGSSPLAEAIQHAGDDPESGQHGHDSETCVICQSLTTPVGAQWKLESHLVGDLYVTDAPNHNRPAIDSASRSIPQPRGPPALSA